ncbi:hypothetical protein JCM21900_004646 [Sporobolomyces salmonicolor]
MASLTDDQAEGFAHLIALGFSEEQARHGALRFGKNAEAAANWIFDNPDLPSLPNDYRPSTPIIQDEIPPLAPADDDLPHPSTIGHQGQPPPYSAAYGPQEYRHTGNYGAPAAGKAPLAAPYTGHGPTQTIDLTHNHEVLSFAPPKPSAPQKLLMGPDDADSDLQRALKASTEGVEPDDDMSKALALSMATLGSMDEEAIGIVEGIAPQDRIREDLETPTVLRATSNLMSGLSAYLQCLYAVPTWRNAILGYRTPARAVNEADDFEGTWKGEHGALGGGLFGVGDTEAREDRLVALQRLFALMHETRRSFIHVSEVVKAFRLRESDFQRGGGEWVYKLKEIHNTIVDDLRLVAQEEAEFLRQQGVESEELKAFEKAAASRFIVRGRTLAADEHIGEPLPAIDDEQAISTAILDLHLNPSAEPPQTLFDRLDSILLDGGIPSAPEYNLLTDPPQTLFFQLERHTEFTSLDSFGSGTGAGGVRKSVFKPEKELFLDRYWVKQRAAIKEKREEAGRLKEVLNGARKSRAALGTTKDGRDAVELVRSTVAYLKKATSEEEKRSERQKTLAEKYQLILEVMEKNLATYDSDIERLTCQMSSLYDSPDWRSVGPYELTALLMRNGLNGRGSAWSVVRGDDGRWWKITDLFREEVELDMALEDVSGLMMDAGATFLFYQKKGEEAQPAEVPLHLKRAALKDNHSFAATLPSSHTSTISSWSLPSLDTLSPAPVYLDFSAQPPPAHVDSDDAETVQNISLDSPSPPPSGIAGTAELEEKMGEVTHDEAMMGVVSSSGAATPMSVDGELPVRGENEEDEEPLLVSAPDAVELNTADAAALRLRGGASIANDGGIEEDEEEYDDDEEIDEDEVELGLLQPMPENKEDWDVDFAVGKVGGLPRWLDPTSPLGPEDVACGVCEKTMAMLLQVNSPDDARPHAAARSLYVFACRGKDCLSTDASKATRVWRTQMPSPNDFFPHTDESTSRRRELEAKLDPTSALSGKPSTSTAPWPEWDIAAEPEPYEESYLPAEAAPAAEDEEGTEDAAEPDTTTGVDRAFLEFQERIEREPKQVLRFYRLPEVEDPQPLWASSVKVRPEDVPACELCSGPRQVEFQVLSTLLSHLNDDSFDFDSLLVYTCLANCPIPPRAPAGDRTGWAREVVYKQDFAAGGVRFGQR